MSRSVCYHFSSAATGTTPGAASIQMIRPGRIYGANFNVHLIGGAAAGRHSYTLELNNSAQSNGDTNNPPRETVLCGHAVSCNASGASSAVAGGNSPFIPLSVPVKPGDIVSLNIVQTGTSPATANSLANLFVTES